MRNQVVGKRKKIVIQKPEFLRLEKGLEMQFRFIPETTRIKDVEYLQIECVSSGDIFLTNVYAFKELFNYVRTKGFDLNTQEFFFHVVGKAGGQSGQKWIIDFYEIV